MADVKESRPGCLAFILNLFGGSSRKKMSPYKLQKHFLSSAEQTFYQALRLTLDGKATICPKVRLADVLRVDYKGKAFWTYFNRISQKHVDFLLCDTKTMQPLAIIELDDKSHKRKDRQERDEMVDAAFRSANVPVFHVAVKRQYQPEKLRTMLREVLEGAPESTKALSSNPPLCPKCGVPMIMRRAKSGKYAGKRFYGCPNYPKCRKILPFKG